MTCLKILPKPDELNIFSCVFFQKFWSFAFSHSVFNPPKADFYIWYEVEIYFYLYLS